MNSFNKKILSVLVISTFSISVAHAAAVTTATGSLNVRAHVDATCSIAAGGLIDFAAYDPSSGTALNADTGSSLQVKCTNATNWKLYSTEADATKIMVTGGATATEQLTYLLYSNAGRTTLLPTTGSASSVIGTGTGSLQTATIYGKIAAGQNVVAGAYTQTINLSIDY